MMKRNTKVAIVAVALPAAVAVLLMSLFVLWRTNDELFQRFRSFSVTVVNQSDYDLVSVETGILGGGGSGQAVKSNAKHTFAKTIKAGDKKGDQSQAAHERRGRHLSQVHEFARRHGSTNGMLVHGERVRLFHDHDSERRGRSEGKLQLGFGGIAKRSKDKQADAARLLAVHFQK
ncbi:hypothetical protein OMP38_16040 [Cohnella ginsengisoli]|uniref:Uncharacterized protein n=1 Tax=Cohnella ginsengisoli TaxID=425004 RepID=A0A9X4KHC5_9BACL|nr:hypothetical protein [Cohnella ginsengisoli]MDG0792207.1 hypothetical protein [Cohnella ginsengisoli]